MMNLIYLKTNIINFYKEKEICYATYHKDWIENDNFGLKGLAKNWSLENLEEDKMHKDITRVEHN